MALVKKPITPEAPKPADAQNNWFITWLNKTPFSTLADIFRAAGAAAVTVGEETNQSFDIAAQFPSFQHKQQDPFGGSVEFTVLGGGYSGKGQQTSKATADKEANSEENNTPST